MTSKRVSRSRSGTEAKVGSRTMCSKYLRLAKLQLIWSSGLVHGNAMWRVPPRNTGPVVVKSGSLQAIDIKDNFCVEVSDDGLDV